MDIGLTVNIGESKHMEVGCHRGMMPNHYRYIAVCSNSYEKVKTFKYSGSLWTVRFINFY